MRPTVDRSQDPCQCVCVLSPDRNLGVWSLFQFAVGFIIDLTATATYLLPLSGVAPQKRPVT